MADERGKAIDMAFADRKAVWQGLEVHATGLEGAIVPIR